MARRKAPEPEAITDPELLAMARAVSILEPLSPEMCANVLCYLARRFPCEKNAALNTTIYGQPYQATLNKAYQNLLHSPQDLTEAQLKRAADLRTEAMEGLQRIEPHQRGSMQGK